MKKTIITTLLLCTGLIAAGCEKTYSVAELKKDPKLMEEWIAKCGFAGTSKNCENLRLAQLELEKEYDAQAAERARQDDEKYRKAMEKTNAEIEADIARMKAAREAKERAQAEREAQEQSEKKEK